MFKLTKSQIFKLSAMFLTTFLFTVSCRAAGPLSLGYVTVSLDTMDNVDSSISNSNEVVKDYSRPRIVRTNFGDIGVIPKVIEEKINLNNENQNNVNVEESESSKNNQEESSYDNNLGDGNYDIGLNQSIPDNDNSSPLNVPSNASSNTFSNTLYDTSSNDSSNDSSNISSNNSPNTSSKDYSSDESSVSDKKSSSSNSKSAVIKTGEDISYLLAIMIASLILCLSCSLDQRKKLKIRSLNKNLNFFCTVYTMMLGVLKKLRSHSQNKEVFCMFDFLKKSRAFKFLCSSCLVCSLGAFVGTYASESSSEESSSEVIAQIGETYVQGPLGFGDDTLILDNNVLTSDGKLSGILKWKTAQTIKNVFNENEDSKLVLFLKKGDSFVAASKSIAPLYNSQKGLSFENVQMYTMTDGSAATPLDDENPGVPFTSSDGDYEIYGLVTDPGITSVIASADSSSEEEGSESSSDSSSQEEGSESSSESSGVLLDPQSP